MYFRVILCYVHACLYMFRAAYLLLQRSKGFIIKQTYILFVRQRIHTNISAYMWSETFSTAIGNPTSQLIKLKHIKKGK